MNDCFKDLELDALLAKVAGLCTFTKAKSYIVNQELSYNPLVIRRNLLYTKEAMNYLKDNLRYSFSEFDDITGLITTLEKQLTLTGKELKTIAYHHIQVKRAIKDLGSVFKEADIGDFLVSLSYSDELIDLLEHYIDDGGDIRKDATARLTELYKEATDIEKDIAERAQQFLRNQQNSLQEAVVYKRDGRTCFLVRNTDKNKYDGYAHGTSASGQATYVEPKVFVELNNRLNETYIAIEEEIRSILTYLSYEASRYTATMTSNLDSIMYLDAIFAKASFGIENDGILAEISEGDFVLKRVAHPLLERQSVVHNDYHILEPIKGIIISGSNTGGKTVSLKVMALSVIMTYLGIPIVADEAKIPLYDAIFTDIDDGQSILDSLSTFSARLVALNEIIAKATSKSFILIDEIASGTDPKEGEALALAIIDKFTKLGATFVVTTHFNKLKEFAMSDKRVLLAAQEFDQERLVPTFRYLENSFGNSNALDIAMRYIDDKDLILKARELLVFSQSEEERMLKILEQRQAELALQKEQVDILLQEAEVKKAELELQLKEFQESEDELFAKAKVKAERYLERQKQKARDIVTALKTEATKTNLEKVEEKLEDLKSEYKEVIPLELKEGNAVKIISTGQVGIIAATKKNAVTVDVRGVMVKTRVDDLEASEAPREEKKARAERSYKRAKSEIVLVGMRKDEAIDTLLRFLDEAFGSGLKQVKIIHGSGTGVLKAAVADCLKQQSYVKSFHYGDSYEGGSNLTVVELK